MLLQKLCKMTLSIGLAVTLAGCQTICQPIPMMPVKPILNPIEAQDGSLLLSRDDAVKLGVYIIELEAGY